MYGGSCDGLHRIPFLQAQVGDVQGHPNDVEVGENIKIEGWAPIKGNIQNDHQTIPLIQKYGDKTGAALSS